MRVAYHALKRFEAIQFGLALLGKALGALMLHFQIKVDHQTTYRFKMLQRRCLQNHFKTTTLQNHFKTTSKPLQFASFVSFNTGPRLAGPPLDSLECGNWIEITSKPPVAQRAGGIC